ncbi:putative phage tail component-like protein [Bacillus pakistanensis]|uniref:Phage tail component-like protein n=1 Tax=Rossellomorea pakistanensis TaxID=992288 RepID=A0ABS2NDC2_9BACI|nr:distal tail protein Dit [Bacillus pakistanensis]MBM7585853.1 putative phage tail component-like protein [Bacillus pakistanensis]
MSFTMKVNGVELPIRVSDVGGRGIIEQEATTQTVPNVDGDHYVKRRLPLRKMPVYFSILASGLEDMRQKVDELNVLLDLEEQAEIVYSDEPDKTYYGFLNGEPDWEEIIVKGKGTLPFMRQPYKKGSSVTVDTSVQLSTVENYEGKISGSTAENKSIFYLSGVAGALKYQFTFEPSQPWYDEIEFLDGTFADYIRSASGEEAGAMFAFDMVGSVEKKLGFSIGETMTDKINWLERNVSEFAFDFWGRGSNQDGYKVWVHIWDSVSNSWTWGTSSTSSSLSNVHHNFAPLNALDRNIDSNGYIFYRARTNATDGVTPAQLDIDTAKFTISLGLNTFTVDNNGAKNPSFIVTSTFSGAASDFFVRNKETGDSVRVIYNFVSGDVLEVDFGKRKVIINGKVNMTTLDLLSSWFKLKRGSNELFISRQNVSNAEITYNTKHV